MFRKETNIIIFSVLAAAAFWVLDASIDYVAHYDEQFLSLLFFNKREVAFRLLVSACFLIYGLFMSRAFALKRNAEESLQKEIESHKQALELLSESYQKHSLTIEELEAYQKQLEEIVTVRTSELKTSNEKLVDEVKGHMASEKELVNSLMAQESIIQAVPDILVVLDTEGKIVRWNRATENISGYTDMELRNKPAFDLLALSDREMAADGIREAYEKSSAARELKILSRTGAEIPVYFSGATLLDGKGTILGLVVIGKDITKSKKAEEEIRFLASIIQTIPEAVCSVDLSWNVVSWNYGAEQMFGFTRAEMLGKPVTVIMEKDSAAGECEHCTEILNRAGTLTGYDSVRVAKSGRRIPVEITAVSMKDSEDRMTGYACIMRDLTERKKVEAEQLRSEKLSSLSVLAGGIAHDFNNVLTAILGNISLSKMRAQKTDQAIYNSLLAAEQASYRARNMTEQLLAFSKSGETSKKTISIERPVKDAIDFALRGSSISCEFHIPDNISPVEVDEGQINQAFHSLAINALQAMPNGGRIRVRCENVSLAPNALPLLKEGAYVKISVEDNGMGIPAEHLNKIFDPYFTTKTKGSGLGLATAYAVIKRHGGSIIAESRINKGTVFHIYLPASGKPPIDKADHGKRLFSGKGKILVMDDEEILRLIIDKMLAETGYKSETAVNGEAAIEQYNKALKSGHPFDAVILDLTVRGGMGGEECIGHLLKIDPGVKAILSSGYTDDPIMSGYREFGFKGIISKPYQIEDMSEVLYKVINEIID